MGPGETFAFIAAVAGMAGTTITLALAWMRHRERMAGAGGKGLAGTVGMLTETLERQHARQAAFTARLDALEAASAAPLGRHLSGETDDVSDDSLVPIGRVPARA